MSHDLGHRAKEAMQRAHDAYDRIWHPRPFTGPCMRDNVVKFAIERAYAT